MSLSTFLSTLFDERNVSNPIDDVRIVKDNALLITSKNNISTNIRMVITNHATHHKLLRRQSRWSGSGLADMVNRQEEGQKASVVVPPQRRRQPIKQVSDTSLQIPRRRVSIPANDFHHVDDETRTHSSFESYSS